MAAGKVPVILFPFATLKQFALAVKEAVHPPVPPVKLLTNLFPAGPVGPVGPVAPTDPEGPEGPVGPVGPGSEEVPVLPVGPVGPAVPVWTGQSQNGSVTRSAAVEEPSPIVHFQVEVFMAISAVARTGLFKIQLFSVSLRNLTNIVQTPGEDMITHPDTPVAYTDMHKAQFPLLVEPPRLYPETQASAEYIVPEATAIITP